MTRLANILWYSALATIVISSWVFLGDVRVSTNEPNYELQANCIAEYDYTHPQQSKFDNLVAALQVCR